MDQVKFNIPASSYFLPVFLRIIKNYIFAFLNQRNVGRDKSIAARLTKIYPKIHIFIFPRSLVIIKDSTYSSALIISMSVYKIIIAIFFKCRIKAGIKFITYIFINPMKMNRVFLRQIIGR